MHERPYDTEAVLQEALATFPEVLAGPTTSGDGGRLLLIRREALIPRTDGGVGVFALDHLFVDGDGVPVLVEVKRSSDTRIRREVIGQMLDYAANATTYWPIAQLQEALAVTVQQQGRTVDEAIAEVWSSGELDDFWKAVETNLRAGRVRLVFVADSLPPELVRVIEFLNAQMSPAEVLGVELHQFVGEGQVVYVPKVIGQTLAAVAKKSAGAGVVWDRDSFLLAAQERCSSAEIDLVHRLLEHAGASGDHLAWGRAATPGVSGWYRINGRPTATWSLNLNDSRDQTRAYLLFYLDTIVRFGGEARATLAAGHLEQISSMAGKIAAARESGWKKWPSVYLPDVAGNEGSLRELFAAMEVLVGDDLEG